MVNETSPGAAERALALSYAPAEARDGLAALFALDDTLAAILRTTREPMVGQMRLTWWHAALTALDTGPPPAHPVLSALAGAVVPMVTGATLAGMVDGWEALLDEPLGTQAMEQFGKARGRTLFAAAGAVLGADRAGLGEAGEGWALADLAANLGNPAQAALARELAAARLAAAMRGRWPRRLRVLGALVLLAREGVAGSPRRVARLLWHRLSGT